MERAVSRTGADSFMTVLSLIALVLLIIGGLNWGLYGLFGIDLVARLFGPFTVAARTVYVLVGLSALCSLKLFALLHTDRRRAD